MTKAICEIETAILSFDLPDVLDLLTFYSSEHQVEEATLLLKRLKSMASDIRSVSSKSRFFGYIVLELLDKSKGSAFCKTCQKEYKAKDLHPFQVGFGDNPLAVTFKEKGGFFKRLFGRKFKPIGLRGGKGFKCPEGHELISMITWIS